MKTPNEAIPARFANYRAQLIMIDRGNVEWASPGFRKYRHAPGVEFLIMAAAVFLPAALDPVVLGSIGISLEVARDVRASLSASQCIPTSTARVYRIEPEPIFIRRSEVLEVYTNIPDDVGFRLHLHLYRLREDAA